MRTSETIAAIAPAIVAALAKIEGASKSAANEAFKRGGKASTYATLGDAIEASRSILAENKLAVMQGVGQIIDGAILITTRLLHESGEWFETCTEVPLGKPDAQGLGSATTYGRRYALMALLNMAAVDDDGNAASEPTTAPSSYAAKKAGLGPRATALKHEIDALPDLDACTAWTNKNAAEIRSFPDNWRTMLRAELETRQAEIRDELRQGEPRQDARGNSSTPFDEDDRIPY